MDGDAIRRKDAVGTLSTAVGWLGETPLLVGVFMIASLVDALGDLSIAFSLLGSVLLVFARGVTHLSAERLARGGRPEFGAVAREVGSRMISLLAVWVLTIALSVVGLVFLILPGIYLALRLSLAGPACVVDDLGTIDSLKRSWGVAGGNLRKLLAIGLIVVVTVLVALVPLSLAIGTILGTTGGTPGASPTGPGVIGGFLGAVIAAVVAPVAELAFARVYLENRPTDTTPAPEQEDAEDEVTIPGRERGNPSIDGPPGRDSSAHGHGGVDGSRTSGPPT